MSSLLLVSLAFPPYLVYPWSSSFCLEFPLTLSCLALGYSAFCWTSHRDTYSHSVLIFLHTGPCASEIQPFPWLQHMLCVHGQIREKFNLEACVLTRLHSGNLERWLHMFLFLTLFLFHTKKIFSFHQSLHLHHPSNASRKSSKRHLQHLSEDYAKHSKKGKFVEMEWACSLYLHYALKIFYFILRWEAMNFICIDFCAYGCTNTSLSPSLSPPCVCIKSRNQYQISPSMLLLFFETIYLTESRVH